MIKQTRDMDFRLHQYVLFIFLLISFCPLYSQNFDALQYRTVGPARGGRVTTVTGIATRPNVFFLGASGGGVWKTEDYGTTWRNVSDGFFNSPSIKTFSTIH